MHQECEPAFVQREELGLSGNRRRTREWGMGVGLAAGGIMAAAMVSLTTTPAAQADAYDVFGNAVQQLNEDYPAAYEFAHEHAVGKTFIDIGPVGAEENVLAAHHNLLGDELLPLFPGDISDADVSDLDAQTVQTLADPLSSIADDITKIGNDLDGGGVQQIINLTFDNIKLLFDDGALYFDELGLGGDVSSQLGSAFGDLSYLTYVVFTDNVGNIVQFLFNLISPFGPTDYIPF